MTSAAVAPADPPFAGGKYRLAMGLAPLDEMAWIEPGADLAAELAAKRKLLESRHAEVFQALPASEAAAHELLRVLAANLARHHAARFTLAGDRIVNKVTGEAWDIASPPLHSLEIAGRLVAEDFCLMQRVGESYILTGATLCAPSRWRLADKIGQPASAIHAPVPGYPETLGRAVEHFFAALKPQTLVGRVNWGIADDPAPFQPVAAPPNPAVTAANAGETLWQRVERQTLRRLPATEAIVFTIRTRITRLDQAIGSAALARDLAAALRDMAPEMQAYKRIAPFAPALMGWLEARARAE
jgi:dimethylamine monooxygenase subunit A